MLAFTHTGTFGGGPDIASSSIRDLVAFDNGAGLRLYMLAADGGSLSVYDPAAGMALLAQRYFQAGSLAGERPRLTVDESGTAPVLLVAGGSASGVLRFALDANGIPGPAQALADPPGGILASQWVDTGTAQVLFTSVANQGGISSWMDVGQGHLSQVGHVNLGGMSGGIDIQAMASLSRGGETYLLLASAEADQMIAMRVKDDGSLRMTGQITSGENFWVDTPSALATARIGGADYVLMAASGTSSIVVARLEADGNLTVTDQINDDLATRFENLTALETIKVGGQVFVVAGGSDDGLSLFKLTPEGRLLHQQSMADTTLTALTDITAISLAEVNGRIEIFASGEGATEVTWLSADPGSPGQVLTGDAGNDTLYGGAAGDILSGRGGDDVLSGGAGDDILIDGVGSDALRGGAGADVFVFVQDKAPDRVLDFEPGVDRLDLSGIGRAYTLEALDFETTADGIRITFGDEQIELVSATGGPLQASDFTRSDLFDLWHVVNDVPPQPPEGQIRISGGPGRDVLTGGAGDDVLNGDYLDPAYDIAYGQVFRLYEATLERAPDVPGFMAWTGQILSGANTLEGIASGFVNSAEFQSTYGSLDNTGFVTLLYQNVLGRAPDAGGLAHWTGLLDNNTATRAQVVLGLSESQEFIADTAGPSLAYSWVSLKSSWADNVFRLYQATLDRAPDAGGLAGWAGQLASGESLQDVASGFVNSAEFQSTYGSLDNTGFVTLLYQNVLGRAPDAGGLAHWTGLLDNDTATRAQVVLGFSESQEFIDASQASLVSYMRGLGSDDRLVGGAGANTLFGGWGADSFVFNATETANDTVIGLEAWDTIELQQSTFADANAALAALSETADGVMLTDGATSILFADTSITDFSADMFVFV